MLRNNIGTSTVALSHLTKSVGGAFINTLDVVTQYLPGNFGVRVIESLPSNLSEVWRERKTVQVAMQSGLEEQYRVPVLMDAPQRVDYPTDEDSDDNIGFSIKIPELQDLLNEFEKDDDTLYKATEALKQYRNECRVKGVEYDKREEEIKDAKKDKIKHLDQNISTQREEWASRLPGMLEDINEVIRDPKNKVYLR